MLPVEKFLIQEPAYCAGFCLPPLSLGTYLILCDRESAYVSGDWESTTGERAFNEMVMALTFCRVGYDVAHKILANPDGRDFDQATRETGAAIVAADSNIVSVSETFSAWWYNQTEVPEIEPLQAESAENVGTEFALRLLASANRILGIDYQKAIHAPYGLLLRAHVHDMEERGHCRLVTDERKEQIAHAMEQTEQQAQQDAEES